MAATPFFERPLPAMTEMVPLFASLSLVERRLDLK
jgi:hypothetical protein